MPFTGASFTITAETNSSKCLLVLSCKNQSKGGAVPIASPLINLNTYFDIFYQKRIFFIEIVKLL